MSNKSSKLHFHFLLQHCSFCHTTKKITRRKLLFLFSCPPPAKKGPKFNLNLQSQAAQESDVSGLSSSSAPSLTDHATHLIRLRAVICIFNAGARGECEGCVGSIDCGTCFQKQWGNHLHVQFCSAVKSAMVGFFLIKSAAPFVFQCAYALTFTVIVMKPLWRAAGSDCGADCSLIIRPMKHTVLLQSFFPIINSRFQRWTVRWRRPHIGWGGSAPWTNTSQWSELYKAPSTKCYKLMFLMYTFTHVQEQRGTKNVCNILWWL